MICEECKQEGKTSQINVGGEGISATMAVRYFYDEEGRYHAHDPNSFTVTFCCTNGHSWSRTEIEKCWCETESNK